MPDRFDESLLVSPLGGEQRRRWPWLLGLAVAALVVVIVAWGFWIDDEPERILPGAIPGSTSELTEASTTTTTTVPPFALEAYSPDPPILHHPTLLPEGWETCRVLDDSSIGDRFCDPNDAESWVQVSVSEPDQVRASGAPPTGDDNSGVWLDRGESNQAAYRRGSAYVVVRNNDTIPSDALLDIAASIPMVADFDSLYGSYEPQLAVDEVTDQQLASLVAEFTSDPTITRRTGEMQVFAPELSVYGFYADGYAVPDLAWTLPRARLIPADRPIVVGELPERRRGYAVWDQAGYGWRVEGQMTEDEAAALAKLLVARIAAFPTQ